MNKEEKTISNLDEIALSRADSMCAELYRTFKTRYNKEEKCLVSELTSGDIANIKQFGYELFIAGAKWMAEHLKK